MYIIYIIYNYISYIYIYCIYYLLWDFIVLICSMFLCFYVSMFFFGDSYLFFFSMIHSPLTVVVFGDTMVV